MFTVPNILSFLRLVLIIPTGYYLWHGENWTAFYISLVGAIFDMADGHIARRFNQVSELGKILDPLADKLFFATVGIILYVQHRIPEWFLWSLVARDLLLLLGGLYASRKLKFVIPANYAGKISAITVALTLILYILNVQPWGLYSLYIAVAVMIWSFVLYVINMIKKLNELQNEPIS